MVSTHSRKDFISPVFLVRLKIKNDEQKIPVPSLVHQIRTTQIIKKQNIYYCYNMYDDGSEK
jgi:hypothetical protein